VAKGSVPSLKAMLYVQHSAAQHGPWCAHVSCIVDHSLVDVQWSSSEDEETFC